MSKRLCITISDYVYDTYLLNVKNSNRSQYIETLIQLGTETILNAEKTNKAQLIKAIQDVANLEIENKKIKQQLQTYKIKFNNKEERDKIKEEQNKRKSETTKQIAFVRAIKNAR